MAPQPFDLCTVADVRSRFGTPTTDDTLVQTLISAASRAIMRHPRVLREFAPLTNGATRVFDVEGGFRSFDLAPYDLRSVTSVTLNGTALVLDSTYALDPLEVGGTFGRVRLGSYVSLDSPYGTAFGTGPRVTIVGNWGIWDTATVADDVRQACCVTVASWMDRTAAEYGGQFADDDGFAVRPTAPTSYAVPMAALLLLQPYARMSF